MKLIFRDVSIGIAYLFFFVLSAISMFLVPNPGPIKVLAPTEVQMKEEFRNEQQAKQIKRATNAARSVFKASGCPATFSELTGRTAVRVGLPPRLLAATIFVESSCRPNAVSGRASIGLMQVNPQIWGHKKDLKDPEKNLKIGANILASYIHRYGLEEGLHHFNGYSEVHGHEYVNKVLTIARIK